MPKGLEFTGGVVIKQGMGSRDASARAFCNDDSNGSGDERTPVHGAPSSGVEHIRARPRTTR